MLGHILDCGQLDRNLFKPFRKRFALLLHDKVILDVQCQLRILLAQVVSHFFKEADHIGGLVGWGQASKSCTLFAEAGADRRITALRIVAATNIFAVFSIGILGLFVYPREKEHSRVIAIE